MSFHYHNQQDPCNSDEPSSSYQQQQLGGPCTRDYALCGSHGDDNVDADLLDSDAAWMCR
jgi:hypothetical protein